MARTTPELVEGIVEVEAGNDLTPFIDTANDMVSDVCLDSEYSESKLELIERWLAAHFYKIFQQATASEKAGSVSENKQYKLGLNLNVTMWGQQALAIDTAGNLARVSKNAEEGENVKASFAWIGKTREES